MIWMREDSNGLILSVESDIMPEYRAENFAAHLADKHPNNIYFEAELMNDNRREFLASRQVKEDNAEFVAYWCGGQTVKSTDFTDPVDPQVFTGVNVPLEDGVGRAEKGDWVVQHRDGHYEIIRERDYELLQPPPEDN